MNFRNISAWSIRNPVPAIVLFLALTIAGLVSFARMQVNDSPDVDFPVVIVSVSQPGAAPTELENQVTLKIESTVHNLQGIDEIDSNVTEDQTNTNNQHTQNTPNNHTKKKEHSAVQQV